MRFPSDGTLFNGASEGTSAPKTGREASRDMMKRLILVASVVFLFVGGAVSLGDQDVQPTDIIWCCDRGRCLRITKEGCDKFGGFVVNSCDNCQ
jgi:hypothetical protein